MKTAWMLAVLLLTAGPELTAGPASSRDLIRKSHARPLAFADDPDCIPLTPPENDTP